MELSTSVIVMDTKLFTKHWNLEILCATRIHPNLLTEHVDFYPRDAMTQHLGGNNYLASCH